ncbi:MAG: hypothetical protein WBB67_02805 [bacterium]
MEEMKSGKELCDDFFVNLLDSVDVDRQIAILLKDLYSEGKFTKEEILQGLQTLRQNRINEH